MNPYKLQKKNCFEITNFSMICLLGICLWDILNDQTECFCPIVHDQKIPDISLAFGHISRRGNTVAMIGHFKV